MNPSPKKRDADADVDGNRLHSHIVWMDGWETGHTSEQRASSSLLVSLLVELRTGLLLLRMEGKGGWSFGRYEGRKERKLRRRWSDWVMGLLVQSMMLGKASARADRKFGNPGSFLFVLLHFCFSFFLR